MESYWKEESPDTGSKVQPGSTYEAQGGTQHKMVGPLRNKRYMDKGGSASEPGEAVRNLM